MQIGGNISGLSGIAGDLTGVAPEVDDITSTLSKRVDSLASDAGWNGDAADTFKGAWEQDGAACDELSKAVKLSGDAISTLSTKLAAAQRKLDSAVSAAKAAGLPVTDSGLPAGTYDDAQLTAARTFDAAVKVAQSDANDARDAAGESLSKILHAINPDFPDDDGDGTGVADLAGLGAVLKGYYVVPKGRVDKMKQDIAKAKADYHQKHAEWKNSKAGSDARKALAQDLKDMRAARTAMSGDLEDAEKVASKFKGGELLDSSVADIAKALGAPLEDGSRLSRALDGLPGLDVAAAGLATWAQAKADHEEGWSWGHAILADGGANAAALAAGLATDAIPYAGPFLAPVVSYGVGAYVTELTHNAHWDKNISEHGVVMGTLDSFGDAGVATWKNDVVGMGDRVAHDVTHPVDAAKGLWHGIKDLV